MSIACLAFLSAQAFTPSSRIESAGTEILLTLTNSTKRPSWAYQPGAGTLEVIDMKSGKHLGKGGNPAITSWGFLKVKPGKHLTTRIRAMDLIEPGARVDQIEIRYDDIAVNGIARDGKWGRQSKVGSVTFGKFNVSYRNGKPKLSASA